MFKLRFKKSYLNPKIFVNQKFNRYANTNSKSFAHNQEIRERLEKLEARYNELGSLMQKEGLSSIEIGNISKELHKISNIAEYYKEFKQKEKEVLELQTIIESSNEGEAEKELAQMAKDDFVRARSDLDNSEENLLTVLLPKDDIDDRSAIIEIRSGAGGLEASLFAADIFRMYSLYCMNRGWKLDTIEESFTDMKGYREVIAQINGIGVYGTLKFESGVHRVQRHPETDKKKIHTSTITVAILPVAEEVDVQIHDKDLRIDTYRSGGAGGQHVNTTNSAVRVTHIPTNTVVCIQDERSQHYNKQKALMVLRSRLYEEQRAKLQQERATERKKLIGTGGREEKIRTYNYPQSRITDHRINYTLFGVEAMMDGELLDLFLQELKIHDLMENILEELSKDDKN